MKLPDEDISIMLDKMYPKSSYEGDFITVENTVDGLKGKVTAEEETSITVCNKNIVGFKQENWIGGYFENLGINGYYDTRTSLIDSTYYPCTPGMYVVLTLKAVCDMNLSRGAIQWYDKDKNALKETNVFWGTTCTAGATVGKAFTVPDDASYFRLNLRAFQYLNEDGETYIQISDMYNMFYDYIYDLQVELSDTTDATDYIEHKEQTYSGTKANILTYDDITHIYNTDSINMTAKVRTTA